MIDREYCRIRDQNDPLAEKRQLFETPAAGTIFLDANSVGAMPKSVRERTSAILDLWVDQRRRGWSVSDWLEKPHRLGAAVAHLLGAAEEDVVAADTTSHNLFKTLHQALALRPDRRVILTEPGNFPTDLHIAQGLKRLLGGDIELRMIDDRDELVDAIGPDVAVVYLSHVDYRTSYRWDMADISARARRAGALTLWDLSHAAGAVPVDLEGSGADLAVCCAYKYLAGGPGAPALVWMRKEHQNKVWPALSGWMGHADLFAFSPQYEPAPGVGCMIVGTPAVIADEIMSAAFDIWKEVDAALVHAKHRSLSETLKQLIVERCSRFGVEIDSPGDYASQGGHVAIRHPHGGPLCEALVAEGVVGSYRKPGVVRFGLGPLWLSHEDMWIAVERMVQVLESESWRDPRFQKVSV